ncbi:helix-turn-helix transcriptional regulator [Paraburkholderia bannensis]|uniref:helix-turn-helix transcriptional regulator n=1 Tax=Paraburkholderia bannensis TaxID=765414 RepID=UPI002AC32E21|nr:helix-turn-helix transcriptional regulator [Paraburkholderia bannensis]
MPYGLEFEEVRFETDHDGKRLKATIPYPMYSALVEFWISVRRAHAAKLEAQVRPGQIKGSMQSAFISSEESHSIGETVEKSSVSSPHFPNDPQWQSLLARMPVTEARDESISDNSIADEKPQSSDRKQNSEVEDRPVSAAHGSKGAFFYRDFMAKPPTEVMKLIKEGVYFLRAWREYRQLTLEDASELFGRTAATIYTHESGRWPPSQATLEKFAQAYDVPILQLVPLPGSDSSPFATKGKRPAKSNSKLDAQPQASTPSPSVEGKREAKSGTAAPSKFWKEPVSPADTEYPDAVLAHLKAGKSPVLAWRLYRGLSLSALAEQYGGQVSNMKAMETAIYLRPSTIAKLCPIFHCKPAQLLRRADLTGEASATQVIEPPPSTPLAPTSAIVEVSTIPLSPMEAAFMRAEATDQQARDRSHTTSADRLARMQQELSRL